ncbi:hypothetical protein CISG_07055 [Coccidioides immitis RMSCC 3703]|uniref:Uncharacterized protein n=1 Tax=Coccidioides immitis RMSCC 3703 TaxID=454286 RepID=A0A0J8R1L4_COCIT|nr:hypothetical protein CISG_07055 [Coccidioides immitis RMSCC 3703]
MYVHTYHHSAINQRDLLEAPVAEFDWDVQIVGRDGRLELPNLSLALTAPVRCLRFFYLVMLPLRTYIEHIYCTYIWGPSQQEGNVSAARARSATRFSNFPGPSLITQLGFNRICLGNNLVIRRPGSVESAAGHGARYFSKLMPLVRIERGIARNARGGTGYIVARRLVEIPVIIPG